VHCPLPVHQFHCIERLDIFYLPLEIVVRPVCQLSVFGINSYHGLLTYYALVTVINSFETEYFSPPTGIGDPALCGSQPLVTPVSLCRFRDWGFTVFLCFLVCILVKIDSR